MPFVSYVTQVKLWCLLSKKERVQLFIMTAPIQNQCKGDEINCDMPKASEKVPIRRTERFSSHA